MINTTLGPIKGQQCIGVYDDVYYSFEKIPFAEKPLGSLRFRPPVAKKSWTEILDCTEKPTKPMQKNLLDQQIEGNEDCLYLNVYCKEVCRKNVNKKKKKRKRHNVINMKLLYPTPQPYSSSCVDV